MIASNRIATGTETPLLCQDYPFSNARRGYKMIFSCRCSIFKHMLREGTDIPRGIVFSDHHKSQTAHFEEDHRRTQVHNNRRGGIMFQKRMDVRQTRTLMLRSNAQSDRDTEREKEKKTHMQIARKTHASASKGMPATNAHFPFAPFPRSTAPFSASSLCSVILIASSTSLALMPSSSSLRPISLALRTFCLSSILGA